MWPDTLKLSLDPVREHKWSRFTFHGKGKHSNQQTYWENMLPAEQQALLPAAAPVSADLLPLPNQQKGPFISTEGNNLSSSRRSPKPTRKRLETVTE